MALTISEAGKNTSTTSSATLVVTLSQSVAAGDMLVVVVAADNAGGGGASSIASVTDSKSHTYTQREIRNRDPGAGAAGATLAIYSAPITTAMTTSDTVTVNFSPNTTSKVALVWELVTASTEFPKYLSNGGSTGNTANPSLQSSSITSGDAVIYGLAVESNASLTGDSDTTNGSWAALYSDTANTGSDLTSIVGGSQNKVVTGTATQTWNTTIVARDWALGYTVFTPAAKITRTATGDGDGTETATGNIVPGSQTVSRTATGSGTGTESASRAFFSVFSTTATGSGTGTESASRLLTTFKTATNTGASTQSADGLVIYPPRTVIYFSSPFANTQGFYLGELFATVSRTATGSGAGTQTATQLHLSLRTATGSGTGTASTVIVRIVPRTALATGTGSQTADGERVILRSATGSGQGTTGSTATGLHIAPRTATGAGTGAATSVEVRLVLRTATGSGSGTQTAVPFIPATIVARTATGSGEGTSTLTELVIRIRTATATGSGTAISAELMVALRTATGAGTGTESSQRVVTFFRTATASGAGTAVVSGNRFFAKTGSATGAGTASAQFIKLLIFRTPSSLDTPAADRNDDSIAGRLFRYAERTAVGPNVYKLLDGSFTTTETRDPVLRTYWGGSNNFVTPQEKAELVAAGYGEYVT